jgi:hypothetical protein
MRKQMGTAGREKYEKEFTLASFENTLTTILKTVLTKEF